MRRHSLSASLVVLVFLLLFSLAPCAGALVSTGDGGWQWLNPLPQGNILRAVSFADATHVWAVGDGGTILASTDGGATWNGQASGVAAGLTGVWFSDASHGWVVGASSWSGDCILNTSDGGAHWTMQLPGTFLGLQDVCFADTLHGCAVGDYGGIVTSDGGLTWTPSAVPSQSTAVSFADADHGCVVSASGYLMTTSDGGTTWAWQQVTVDPWMQRAWSDVWFTDASHGWLVGIPGVYATSDGGVTWERQDAAQASSVSFLDSLHGWVTCGVTVMSTSDGGDTWITHDTGSRYGVSDISFADATHGCAIGGGSYANADILTTGDGGLTWKQRCSGPAETTWFLDVCFTDDTHGWAATTPGIMATDDGGATWILQEGASGRSIAFPDSLHGWAVGGSSIWHTNDAGDSWAEQSSGGVAGLWAVSSPDAQHAWTVGGNGIIATADAGETWHLQDSTSLLDVCFVDAQHGWAVGEWYYWPPQGVGYWDGIIMATVDGGATWTVQAPRTGGRMFAVDFCDAQHGWAVGQGVFATSDGGLTWKAQASGGGEFNDVKALTPDQCWAVGVGSRIIHTQDGGATWQGQNSGKTTGPLDIFYGVDFTDASRGWVVGSDGAVLTTTTGGTGTDITPPTSTVLDTGSGWRRLPVPLTFFSDDNGWGLFGTGVAVTQYSTDGGASWSDGTTMTVTAPLDHSHDGANVVSYRSRDNAGNVEPVRSHVVNIDTRKPRTSAPSSATVRRGAKASLKYKVLETGPNGGTATAVIKVKNRAGKVLKTLTYQLRPVNTLLTARFVVPRTAAWRAGTYRYFVYATDAAGNKQANVASNRLILK